MDYFNIELEKEEAIYNVGDTISGVLKVRPKQRIQINIFKIVACGEIEIHWEEPRIEIENVGEVKNDQKKIESELKKSNVHVRFRKKCLSIERLLFPKDETNLENSFLEPIDNKFPFKFTLPDNLPSSFEHQIGVIKYSLIGVIEIPSEPNKYCEKQIKINRILDLTKDVLFEKPCEIKTDNMFCFGSCFSSKITAKLFLFKSGFVPGEKIFFKVSIKNKTSKEIKFVKLSLFQYIRFKAKNNSKIVVRYLDAVKLPKTILAKTVEQWDNDSLKIPSNCLASCENSSFIEFNYELCLKYFTSDMEISNVLNLPITIGTIPTKSD